MSYRTTDDCHAGGTGQINMWRGLRIPFVCEIPRFNYLVYLNCKFISKFLLSETKLHNLACAKLKVTKWTLQCCHMSYHPPLHRSIFQSRNLMESTNQLEKYKTNQVVKFITIFSLSSPLFSDQVFNAKICSYRLVRTYNFCLLTLNKFKSRPNLRESNDIDD